MTRYDKAFKFMLDNEGGLADDPDDLGGKTAYGVSIVWYPKTYWKLIRAKTHEERELILHDFYLTEFWNPLYDDIHSESLAIRLFDLGVNLGVKPSVRLLQQAINAFGYLLKVDGKFGSQTLWTANHIMDGIYKAYIDEAKKYYETRRTFWKHGKSWLNRLKKIIPDKV